MPRIRHTSWQFAAEAGTTLMFQSLLRSTLPRPRSNTLRIYTFVGTFCRQDVLLGRTNRQFSASQNLTLPFQWHRNQSALCTSTKRGMKVLQPRACTKMSAYASKDKAPRPPKDHLPIPSGTVKAGPLATPYRCRIHVSRVWQCPTARARILL